MPLFPDKAGKVFSKAGVTRLARVSASVCNTDLLESWGPTALEKWAEHSFRVSGAQMSAKAGVEVHVIQLLGRWGSQAVARYVQEAALEEPEKASAAVRTWASRRGATPPPSETFESSSPALLQTVKIAVSQCLQGSGELVRNTRTLFAHKPCSAESSCPSQAWVTACGKWRYGLASCFRNPVVLPGFQLCSACFPGASSAELWPSDESSRDSSSSSSES